MHKMTQPGLGGWLWLWFSATLVSFVLVAIDLARSREAARTPGEKIQRLGWLLNTLYMGAFCALVYRVVRTQDGATGQELLWKQAARSTMHCAAGQMSGMLLAALLSHRLHLSNQWELVSEYSGGLLVGLLAFKAPGLRADDGRGYWKAVGDNWLGEMLAMNMMMAGQIPIMAFFLWLDGLAMQPGSIAFWGMMSFSFIAGSLATFPWMYWQRYSSRWSGLSALLTFLLLAAGVATASLSGYFHDMGVSRGNSMLMPAASE